jgi:small subunit ribosomal protein S13
LASTDLDGSLSVERAMRRIKGISFMLSKAICIRSGVDPSRKLETLSPEELKAVENEIQNPSVPTYMLNKRNDVETGQNTHLIATQLDLRKRDEIHFMRKIRCYRGIRHELGLPVRGQRTRSSFRTQKTVGVVKKKQMPAKAAK